MLGASRSRSVETLPYDNSGTAFCGGGNYQRQGRGLRLYSDQQMAAAWCAESAATAVPVPISTRQPGAPLFELPFKKRKQRRIYEQEQQEQQQRVILEAHAASRSKAQQFVITYLEASEWYDQMDQITVCHDAVPSMYELESYAALDEKEGTRACRKLFKAPVVWDELGHGLWKTLRTLDQQDQQAQPSPFTSATEDANKDMHWRTVFEIPTEASDLTIASRRSSARSSSSEDSYTGVSSRDLTPSRMTLSSSPGRQGSIPRLFSRFTTRR